VTASRRFDCAPASVPAARSFVREALSNMPAEVRDTAELLTSELATNCVRHAHTDFQVEIRANEAVRVEVRDAGPGQPRVLRPGPTAPSGRGLLIVSSLASSWGVARAKAGKSVWFTLARA
jgi:anti-sigma regulatory factor (Ser/Thr protein kinase)